MTNMPNRLILGDNVETLDRLREEIGPTVNLVYIDPPFNSGVHRPFLNRDGSADEAGFSDRFENHLEGFMDFMKERLIRIHALLHETGSLVLHCDYRTSPYLQIMCDQIFGLGDRGPETHQAGFRNEIIWTYGLGGSSKRCYPKKHDSLLWYSKSDAWTFNPPMVPATSQKMKGQMKKCPDVWDIPSLNNMAKERTGYPTQKPIALLERIVKAHTQPGDLVLDAFCGSGTTLVAAELHGRTWIGCDAQELAISTSSERIKGLDKNAAFAVEKAQ
jgi:DNA modification methylase